MREHIIEVNKLLSIFYDEKENDEINLLQFSISIEIDIDIQDAQWQIKNALQKYFE